MACARLGRLRAPAMAFALRRELVRLGHRLFGAGAAYGARARLVRRRLVARADHAAACDRGLAIGPLWARTGERHAGRRRDWGACPCCDPSFRDDEGAFALAQFADKFFDHSVWGLDCLGSTLRCGVAWNT